MYVRMYNLHTGCMNVSSNVTMHIGNFISESLMHGVIKRRKYNIKCALRSLIHDPTVSSVFCNVNVGA